MEVPGPNATNAAAPVLGTEAAAATGVVIKATSVPILTTFRADHPFLFLIRDRRTDSLLFLGRVANPTAS